MNNGLSTRSDVSRGARGLIFDLSLPYFKYVRNGGPIVTAHMSRLFRVLAAQQWNKYQNLVCRCPSLSCPLDSLPPGGQANRGWLVPRGASCPGISCPPPWLSSPPGDKLSRPVYLAPPPNTSKNIYMLFCYFSVSF